MIERGYGRIVLVASIAGKEGNPMAAAYSAIKAAVIAMTKAIGKDVAGTGVLVNCIAPAVIETPILAGLSQHHIDYMVERIPLGRMGTADEVAALACFLASEDCSFSTGATYDISGGRRDVLMLRFRYHTSEGIVDGTAESPDELASYTLARPVEPPEIWGAGVTYERSRDARIEESSVKDVYALVYDAERPELFLKDAGCRRTVGPGEPIGVRSDSSWDVPEPEIALVLGEGGALAGLTIGNDVSSRDIEGANPLYLPQAKIFAGACAIGPAVLVPDDWEAPLDDRAAHHRRGRRRALRGRDLDGEDAALLCRARRLAAPRQPRPGGSVLLTGTGLVPPDDFTLEPGHMVEITRAAGSARCETPSRRRPT